MQYLTEIGTLIGFIITFGGLFKLWGTMAAHIEELREWKKMFTDQCEENRRTCIAERHESHGCFSTSIEKLTDNWHETVMALKDEIGELAKNVAVLSERIRRMGENGAKL
jgi:hypothetical protein